MKIALLLICGMVMLILPSSVKLTQFNPDISTPKLNQREALVAECLPSLPPKNFRDLMKQAYIIGREVGDPETIQAILLQESDGGRSSLVGNLQSPLGKRSYGVMQVQLSAAWSVLDRFPHLYKLYFNNRSRSTVTDEEMIALLLTNATANIRIAAYHFKLYATLCNGDWDKTVVAYNVGIGAVEEITDVTSHKYVVDIREKIETVVRPFNQKWL